MLVRDDRRLKPEEIAEITGVKASSYNKQKNLLTKAGIHCFVNAAREVVVYQSWVQLAGIKSLNIMGAVSKNSNSPKKETLDLDFSVLDEIGDVRH